MLTDSMYVVAKYLEKLLTDNQATLGFADVFYGDQDRIPRTPAACVETGEKSRELVGAPRRTEVTITNYILVYHNPVKSVETIREEDDLLSELVESLVHQDPQMKDAEGEDQVIDSLVTSVESGYQQKSNTLFRASRITVEARSRVQLPSSI
jgi:hypothetical protein